MCLLFIYLHRHKKYSHYYLYWFFICYVQLFSSFGPMSHPPLWSIVTYFCINNYSRFQYEIIDDSCFCIFMSCFSVVLNLYHRDCFWCVSDYCIFVAGKTRTKDKYRVVYSDHQRLELEKEFHYSRYITIRRKAELAASLGLSERQVINIVYLKKNTAFLF